MKGTLSQLGAIAIATITVAALGAGVTALLLAPTTPQALSAGQEPQTLRVTEQEFADDRSVEASITVSKSVDLTAPVGGRVTGLQCSVGTPLVSGQSMISIDGTPILNLATSVPLWRSLQTDDSGEDVRALQAELARLGQPIDVDGVFGGQTLSALSAVLASIGDKQKLDGSLPLSRVLWMPAPTVAVASCAVALGSAVESGGPVATLPGGIAQLRVTNYPSDLLAGDRVIEVGGVAVPIGADGTVAGDALAPLSTTAEFAAALTATDPTTFTAKLSLVQPVKVAAIPPTAVYGIDGSTGCVLSEGKGVGVRIAGSQLGQTFVVFEAAATPTTIELQPSKAPACR